MEQPFTLLNKNNVIDGSTEKVNVTNFEDINNAVLKIYVVLT